MRTSLLSVLRRLSALWRPAPYLRLSGIPRAGLPLYKDTTRPAFGYMIVTSGAADPPPLVLRRAAELGRWAGEAKFCAETTKMVN